MIGAVYDDGVGAGDVYSVLNDGSRHEHIMLKLNEIEHHAPHLFLVHLPVANHQARLRYQAMNKSGNRFDCFNAIVDEEHLPASSKFEFNRRLDNVL